MRNSHLNRIFKIKLQKGDLIVVTRGKLKGQKGRVTAVYPRLNKVSVDGLNIVKKHSKPTKENPQGGILEISRPLGVSKVALFEPDSQQPSRSGVRLTKDGKKERFYKRGGKPVHQAPAQKQSKAKQGA